MIRGKTFSSIRYLIISVSPAIESLNAAPFFMSPRSIIFDLPGIRVRRYNLSRIIAVLFAAPLLGELRSSGTPRMATLYLPISLTGLFSVWIVTL
jgi:hypothetical protein